MKNYVGLLLLLLASGCGWHAGLVPPEGAETIGIQWFSVEEGLLERDLEPRLQEALTRAVSDLVDLRLVDPREADLVLTGQILDYSRRGGIRSPQHQLLQTSVRITVDARLERRTSGVVLAQTHSTLPAGYVTAVRSGTDPSTGETTFDVAPPGEEDLARARALRILAESMVLELFTRREGALP